MTDTFGTRLRTERERRKIALSSIAENTKIGIALLQGLERDDVSRWPSGIFRKSFVRSYALALGLDPEPIVREFMERHPDPLHIATSGPNVSPGPGAPLSAAGDARSRAGVVVKLTIVPPLTLRRWVPLAQRFVTAARETLRAWAVIRQATPARLPRWGPRRSAR